MSSLLGSIFGADPEKETASQSLFEKSEALPERPQHKPAAAHIRKKKKKRDDSKIDGDASNDDPSNQKKRKKRKPKSDSNDAESGEKQDDATSNNDESKEDTPDEKNKDRTIFVGNLPLAITRKELAALFKDCGPVASSRIRSVPITSIKLPQEQAGNQKMMRKVCVNTNQIDKTLTDKVQGYVVFKKLDAVEKALEMNNKLEIDGMKIRVDRGTPTVDPSRSVFVGNLPYAAKESTLQEHFEKGCVLEPGDIMGVRIVRDKETFQCKGFGYVLFRDKNAVPTALKLHESTYMKKKIRVMVCGKRFKGRKGQAAPPPRQKPRDPEKVTVGAFRRIIAKQTKEALGTNKRKRGEKKKNATVIKAGASNLSKRAALDKKVDKKVRKLEKRAAKGMGKNKR